ncbi:MAG: PLP-dependent transferase [Spirochaetota bacterium]
MTARGLQTLAIHGGIHPSRNRGATTIPLYNSSSFAFESAEDLAKAFEGRHPGYIYSRITNPTVQAFEQRVAAIEGGAGTVATSSGMAAIQSLFYALTEAGSEVLFSRSLFGGTVLFLRDIAVRAGITVTFVDLEDTQAVDAALARRPRFLFFETVGNPKLDIPPMKAAIDAAASYGVPTVVDATVSSPALFSAKAWGAAAVMHSTTKLITGSGTVIGGVVTDLGQFDWSTHASSAIRSERDRVGNGLALVAALRKQAGLNAGLVMSPFNAFVSALGLETLPLRAAAQGANALALAEYLSTHPKAASVRYPGLAGDPYHDRERQFFRGSSGQLVTFCLEDRRQAFAFMNALELAMRATNLGDAKTLVIHPASTIFHDCAPEERAYADVSEGMVRVSVGLESSEDIIEDFDRAFASCSSRGEEYGVHRRSSETLQSTYPAPGSGW